MARRLEVPQGIHFTCTQCGDCCRGWDVLLGPGEDDAIGALAWEGKVDALTSRATTERVHSPGLAGRLRLHRKPDGSCVFLGERKQCLVHEHFGADRKPLLCRLFPFSFFVMGDRVGVDVSFYCRSVSRGDGEPLEGRVPGWAHLLSQWQEAPEGRELRLTAEQAVDAALAWDVEHQILSLLSAPGMGLLDRVRSVLQWVRLATTGDPSTEAAATMRAALAKGVARQIQSRDPPEAMDRTQRNVFYQWLFLTLNPAPPGYEGLPPQLQEKAKRALTRAGDGFRALRGRPAVGGRELTATFEAIAAVDASLLAEGSEPLETFLRNKILGQKFLRAAHEVMPIVEATHKLMLCYPMAIWTASALAADRGAGAVADEDVRGALRLIDLTYGQVSTALLPPRQAKALDWTMTETELPERAAAELLGVSRS